MLLDEVTSVLDPRAGRGGSHRHPRGGGIGHDEDDRNAGDGLRAADRRPGVVHARRRVLGSGPPEQIFGSAREERTQGFLKRIVEAGRAADVAAGS
jgi:hypothetical protein